MISTRTEMQAGDTYALCQSDPTVVCVKPQSTSTSRATVTGAPPRRRPTARAR